VRAGSPAAAAGVQIGDTVVQVDGKSILSPGGHLRLIRAQSGSVGSVALTVRRDGVERTIDVTIERK
jgi:S1-C subfamily serine protease